MFVNEHHLVESLKVNVNYFLSCTSKIQRFSKNIAAKNVKSCLG